MKKQTGVNKINIDLPTLNGGENLVDDLTHGLWCTKCPLTKFSKSGKKAFFIQNGESVCKKHFKQLTVKRDT